MLGNFTYTTILGHVFAHLVDIDISETSAALCLTVLAGCGMFGKVILGYLTEKLQTRFVMMVCFVVGQAYGLRLHCSAFLWDLLELLFLYWCKIHLV